MKYNVLPCSSLFMCVMVTFGSTVFRVLENSESEQAPHNGVAFVYICWLRDQQCLNLAKVDIRDILRAQCTTIPL